jgi:hypothetical protein
VGAAGDGLARRVAEDLDAIEIEQAQGLRDHEADVAAGLDPALEQDVEAGDRGAEPIPILRFAGGALVLEQLGAMLGRLDLLVPSPAAYVSRHLLVAVRQAHSGVTGDERQRLPTVHRWSRIRVGVEMHEGGLVDGDGQDEVRLGERVGQREQALPLLGEHLLDASLGPPRVRTRIGDLVQEDEQLGTAALDVANRARGEEAVPQEADRPLDTALRARSLRDLAPALARAGVELLPRGDRHDARAEICGSGWLSTYDGQYTAKRCP